MAITTMDSLVAAYPGQHRHTYRLGLVNPKAVGAYQSFWGSTAASGNPGTPAYPGASTTWSVLSSSTPGALPFTNPVSGYSYLGRIGASSTTSGTFVIYDRLAQTGAITPAASTQSLTTATLTRPDVGGDDVELWFEWVTASSATASNFSCSYTNSAGASGQTTQLLTAQTSSVIGQMQPFRLAASDTGVKSVESFTGTGAIGGTGVLVLLRRVAELHVPTSNVATVYDPFLTGLPRVYDNACLAFFTNPLSASAAGAFLSTTILQG